MIIQIDTDALANLHLDIDIHGIAQTICRQRKLNIHPSEITVTGENVVISIKDTSNMPARGAIRSEFMLEEAGDLLLRANFLR